MRSERPPGPRRMDAVVEGAVGGLEAQQVAVGPGLAPRGQLRPRPLAQAQRDGQRRLGLDPAHELGHPVGRDARVFARLEHDRAVAELDGLTGAGEHFLARHAVAVQAAVLRPQAAIAAQPDAVVGQLDQPPQMDSLTYALLAGQVGILPQLGQADLVGLTEPSGNLEKMHGGGNSRAANPLYPAPPLRRMTSSRRKLLVVAIRLLVVGGLDRIIRGRWVGTHSEGAIEANAMSEQRDQFQNRVRALVEQVRGWAEPHEWVTKEYTKRIRDADNQVYPIPALLLQKGPTRVLLDPVAYDVPGAEGVVDLYLMPTYDDLASLYFEGEGWKIHYAFPADPGETHSVIETKALPLNGETLNEVLDSIAAHAEPSF